MTREEAIAAAKRMQTSDPDARWIATEQDGEWTVVRIGVVPTKSTGTATKPRRSRLVTIHTPRSNARRGSPAEVAELGALALFRGRDLSLPSR
jgi:hypothetical protein